MSKFGVIQGYNLGPLLPITWIVVQMWPYFFMVISQDLLAYFERTACLFFQNSYYYDTLENVICGK